MKSNNSKSKNELSSSAPATSSSNLQRPTNYSLQVKDVIPEKEGELLDAIAEREESNPEQPAQQQTVFYRPVRRMVNPYDEFLKEQERILQARKEAKEKYTKISATQILTKKTQPLKYIIKEGNNHWIIQKIMGLRVSTVQDQVTWEETTSYDSLYNFKWYPFATGIKYDQISTYGVK